MPLRSGQFQRVAQAFPGDAQLVRILMKRCSIRFWSLPRDVFPDLSAPLFNVITQNATMGAEELETAVTIPVEIALTGLPDVRRIRSSSQLGVSQVTIEFSLDSDFYRARQLVGERMA